MALHDPNGKTQIRDGDVIIFRTADRLITVLRDGQPLMWGGRDDKLYTHLLKQNVAPEIAIFLGDVLGLAVKAEPNKGDGYERFKFYGT